MTTRPLAANSCLQPRDDRRHRPCSRDTSAPRRTAAPAAPPATPTSASAAPKCGSRSSAGAGLPTSVSMLRFFSMPHRDRRLASAIALRCSSAIASCARLCGARLRLTSMAAPSAIGSRGSSSSLRGRAAPPSPVHASGGVAQASAYFSCGELAARQPRARLERRRRVGLRRARLVDGFLRRLPTSGGDLGAHVGDDVGARAHRQQRDRSH